MLVYLSYNAKFRSPPLEIILNQLHSPRCISPKNQCYVIPPSSYRSCRKYSSEIPYAFLVAYIQNILLTTSQQIQVDSQHKQNSNKNIVREGSLSNCIDKQHNDV
jgi:hypothetical protein